MWMKCTSEQSCSDMRNHIWPIHWATVHQLLHFCQIWREIICRPKQGQNTLMNMMPWNVSVSNRINASWLHVSSMYHLCLSALKLYMWWLIRSFVTLFHLCGFNLPLLYLCAPRHSLSCCPVCCRPHSPQCFGCLLGHLDFITTNGETWFWPLSAMTTAFFLFTQLNAITCLSPVLRLKQKLLFLMFQYTSVHKKWPH